MGLGYASIGITLFSFYVFASLEMIAESIEDPFGLDPDDLPTDTMAGTIHQNVQEIIRK
ncbi:MAG: bestrophin family ion channel [Owenweeksia sp.]|nr:bestrophin family ion channel [Owenweeksia sp.]